MYFCSFLYFCCTGPKRAHNAGGWRFFRPEHGHTWVFTQVQITYVVWNTILLRYFVEANQWIYTYSQVTIKTFRSWDNKWTKIIDQVTVHSLRIQTPSLLTVCYSLMQNYQSYSLNLFSVTPLWQEFVRQWHKLFFTGLLINSQQLLYNCDKCKICWDHDSMSSASTNKNQDWY